MSNIAQQVYEGLVEGFPAALYLEIASMGLVYWEYCITFGEEVQYFWHGRWNLSRILFLVNRYLTLINAIIALRALAYMLNTGIFLTHLIDAVTILTAVIMTVIEMMHAIRIWYLFSHNAYVRWAIAALSLAYFGAEVTTTAIWLATANTNPQVNNGKLWIPPLVVHTILYGMTILRAVFFKPASGDARAVMARILQDGFMFFSTAFASTAFTTIGALQANPRISLPARFSQFFLAMTSIAMSRMMLRIRSFSASLGTDSEWLLSHLEMSRMQFRKGSHEGELFVEVDNVGLNDYELTNAADEELTPWADVESFSFARTPTETLVAHDEIRQSKLDQRSDLGC